MPSLSIPKSALEPRAKLPSGFHQIIFQGFKQKLSKPKADGSPQSVNLHPQLRIVNSPIMTPDGKSINGMQIFDSLNLSFPPRLVDFLHAFGLELVPNGDDYDIPGYFDGIDPRNETDPEKWGVYHGPLENATATVELAEEKAFSGTGTVSVIKRYVCNVPNCKTPHMESLLRSSR